MTEEKRRQQINELLEQTTIAIIATERLINTFSDYVDTLNEIQFPDRHPSDDWIAREEEQSAMLKLDVHATSISGYQLVKTLNTRKQFRHLLSENMKTCLELLRHHHEHWDSMRQFYVHRPGADPIRPPSGSNVERYKQLYGDGESPLGSYGIDYVPGANGQLIKEITVGGSLKPLHYIKELESLRNYLKNTLSQ